MNKSIVLTLGVLSALSVSQIAAADCKDLPGRSAFENAVAQGVTETNQFGFGLPMWVTMVDNTGKVCEVFSYDAGANAANTGTDAGNKAWLGSRVISAQKANTANAFSLDNLAISTGAVYVAVVPGGSLYGLQHSNPVDASRAYGGSPATYGTKSDFLKNNRIGGVNVFGGGVALYNASGKKVGAIGASGDTSCRDHTVAYQTRRHLGLANQPNDDSLKLVATPAALFEQPACGVKDPTAADDVGIK